MTMFLMASSVGLWFWKTPAGWRVSHAASLAIIMSAAKCAWNPGAWVVVLLVVLDLEVGSQLVLESFVDDLAVFGFVVGDCWDCVLDRSG